MPFALVKRKTPEDRKVRIADIGFSGIKVQLCSPNFEFGRYSIQVHHENVRGSSI